MYKIEVVRRTEFTGFPDKKTVKLSFVVLGQIFKMVGSWWVFMIDSLITGHSGLPLVVYTHLISVLVSAQYLSVATSGSSSGNFMRQLNEPLPSRARM